MFETPTTRENVSPNCSSAAVMIADTL
jgi:hypothetical protein